MFLIPVHCCQRQESKSLHYFFTKIPDYYICTNYVLDYKDTVFWFPLDEPPGEGNRIPVPSNEDLITSPSDAVNIAWIILKRKYQKVDKDMNVQKKFASVQLLNDSIWKVLFLGTRFVEKINLRKKDGKVLSHYITREMAPYTIEEFRERWIIKKNNAAE